MATAKSKEYYQAQGKNDARAHATPIFSRSARSWQAHAYLKAFDEETERLANSRVLRTDDASKVPMRALNYAEVVIENGRVIKDRSREIEPACHTHPPARQSWQSRTWVINGPLYPRRVKGRSKRGWTAPKA